MEEKAKISSWEAVTVIQEKFLIKTETKPVALEIRGETKYER